MQLLVWLHVGLHTGYAVSRMSGEGSADTWQADIWHAVRPKARYGLQQAQIGHFDHPFQMFEPLDGICRNFLIAFQDHDGTAAS